VSSRSPAEVSFYLGLATATATFSAAAVALGLLQCTRPRDRAVSVGVLLCATLGIGAALATIARGRTGAFPNIVIGVGVLTVAAYVLIRALRLIFTVRRRSRLPAGTSADVSSTHGLPVIWTRLWARQDASSGGSAPGPPPALTAATKADVLRGPLWATASAFAAVLVLTAVFALPELFESILRSQPVGLTRVACSDGLDNDRDGKTDYRRDPGCTSANDPAEKDPACSDRRDNDQDGKTDYPQDPGCTSANGPAETDPDCSDRRDNDHDGKTDYPQDPGCTSANDPVEASAPCSDGLDNDGDGKTDYPQDPGCSSANDPAEKQ
jgi:hypothetical protein